jgi:hypothetical protein
MLGMSKDEYSQFYARLSEIQRIQNPQLKQQQLQALLKDYPGAMALAKEQGDLGGDLVEQSGPADMIQGPYQNPFSVNVADTGGNVANALRTFAGGKMMAQSRDDRRALSKEMTNERTKLANAYMNQNQPTFAGMPGRTGNNPQNQGIQNALRGTQNGMPGFRRRTPEEEEEEEWGLKNKWYMGG